MGNYWTKRREEILAEITFEDLCYALEESRFNFLVLKIKHELSYGDGKSILALLKFAKEYEGQE